MRMEYKTELVPGPTALVELANKEAKDGWIVCGIMPWPGAGILVLFERVISRGD